MTTDTAQTECAGPRPPKEGATPNPRLICRHDKPALAVPGTYLCKGHTKRLTTALDDADQAMGLLLQSHHKTAHADDGDRVSGSSESPAPINVAVVDCQDRLADLVAVWAFWLAEARHLTYPPRYGDQTRMLRRHAEWICQSETAARQVFDQDDPELGTRADLVVTVNRAINLVQSGRPRRRRLPVRHAAEYGGCGALAIFQDDGEEDAYCARESGGCGKAIAAEDLARWLGRTAA